MTSMNRDSTLLKTDGRGRVRTPLAQREALLDEFERSGLSGMRFAALHGVKYPSFANWVQRRRRERGADGPGESNRQQRDLGDTVVQWLEAEVRTGEPRAAPLGLMLHLPGGLRVELTQPHHVRLAAQLVQALAVQPAAAGALSALVPC